MIGVLIINYNSYEDTIECVKSIRKNTYDSYKIFILDNASSNNSFEILLDACSDCVVVRSEVNLGFGGGNNKLVEVAEKYGIKDYLLLNSDTIVGPDFFENLCYYYNEKNVVTPRMMYYAEKNMIWYGGGHYSQRLGMGFHENENKIYPGTGNNTKVTFLTGCCLLISKSVIDDIGGLFDDNYFMYYEDVDLSYRLLKKNIDMFYVDSAVLYHKVSRTTGGTNSPFTIYYSTRNRVFFMKKYRVCALGFLYFYLTRIIKMLKMSKVQRQSMLTGISDGRKKRMGKREEIVVLH